MSEIKIEKGIPFSTSRRKYPFAEMKVGESFVAPAEKRTSISASSARYKPKKFSTALISETEVRCWRVK